MRLDAIVQDRRVGDEQIVADELHLSRSAAVSIFQPFQSASSMPSSIDRIG